MAFYGIGSKQSIMAQLAEMVKEAGINYVDYQRSYEAAASPENTPGAFINDIDETRTRLLKDLYENNLSVGIVFWARANQNENLWALLHSYATAIKQAIASDYTLNQQAFYSAVTRISTDAGTRFPKGVCVMIVNVIYFSEE